MSFETQTTRIEQLVWLINGTKTGTAEELDKKLGVSLRTIFKDLEFLKGNGYKICFRKPVRSYFFEKNTIILNSVFPLHSCVLSLVRIFKQMIMKLIRKLDLSQNKFV